MKFDEVDEPEQPENHQRRSSAEREHLDDARLRTEDVNSSSTAASCSARRGTTGIGLISSTMPTAARQAAAASTIGIAWPG